eukprot:CFRG1733T1
MTDSRQGPLKIGNYILGATLGVGSFGKVKLARHQHTNMKVAVKILNRKKIRSLDMFGKIKREIQNLNFFSHPHIIKLYEVISTPTDIFMVMEYVAGGELFEYIVKHGKLSEDAARSFFQQIISGVEYCHRHKVVHRDLKPENLLLDTNNNVKIADFGLSNIMTDGDFLKTSCGSPNYAAPEVISGKLYSGPEVDVWSCGVVLYALLCGKLPFDDEYIPNLFRKIKGGIFNLPSHLSSDSKEVLQALLQVDPLKRASIAWIRNHPWFKVNLPRYLEPNIAYGDGSGAIDEDVVATVCTTMSVDKEELLMAINTAGDNDPLKIAYNLVRDNKRMKELSEMKHDKNGNRMFTDSEQLLQNQKAETSNVMPLEELPTMGMYIHQSKALGVSVEQVSRSTKKSRWHLGIRSRSQPYDVMSEVFRAMQSVDLSWKVVNPYHVITRKTHPVTNQELKVSLQLYKVDDRHFLLDFKNLGQATVGRETYENSGSVAMGFFELCAILIRELAVGGGSK